MENETEIFNAIYKELCEIIGQDATMELYWRFKGQQVCFPVRLYDPVLIKEIVLKEFDGTNITELAQKYDYSEKTIRRMLQKK